MTHFLRQSCWQFLLVSIFLLPNLLSSQSQFFGYYDLGTIQPAQLKLASDKAGNHLLAYYANQDIGLIKTDALGQLLWHKTYDSGGNDQVFRIAATDSTYLLVGGVETTATDGLDYLLLVTDHNGDPLPSYRFDHNDEDDRFFDVLPIDNGVMMVGYGGTFPKWEGQIVNLDANLQVNWNKTSSVGNRYVGNSAIEPTADGGYIIVGGIEANAVDKNDVYVLKIDANGSKEWSKSYGSAENDGASAVVQLPDGGYLITGGSFGFDSTAFRPQGFIMRLDSLGNKIYLKTNARFGGLASILPMEDGNFVISGNVWGNPAFAVPRYSIEKITPDATSLWWRFFGTTFSDDPRELELQPDGGILMAGLSFNVTGTSQVSSPALALADTSGRVGCTDSIYQPVIFDSPSTVLTPNETWLTTIEQYPITFTATTTMASDSQFCCVQNFDMQFDHVEVAPFEIQFTSAAPSGGVTYAWDFGDGSTSTDVNPRHTYAGLGTYTVCLTLTSACGTQTECFPVTVGGVSRDESFDPRIEVFPNPAKDHLRVSWEVGGTPVEVVLVDLWGRRVAFREVMRGEEEIVLGLEGIAVGLYQVVIRGEEFTLVRKVWVRE